MRLHLLFVYLAFFSINLHAQSFISTEKSDTEKMDTRSVPLSTTELDEAQLWGLTPHEWERYIVLMRGIRGRLSAESISPIEVLGIHAESEAERVRYARTWAELLLEDAERVLRFQRAYDDAISQLTKGQSVIDPIRLQNLNKNSELKLDSDDRILFFATLDCPVCWVLYQRISELQNQVKSIDIYFVDVDESNQREIGNWAKQAKISPASVKSGDVSLNLDNGMLNELAPHIQAVPYLLLVRKGKVQKFPLELLP